MGINCKNGIQLRSYDYSKRMVKERIDFIYGQVIYRFQYSLDCANGFKVNFEKFEDIVIDSTDGWTNIMRCRIPGSEFVSVESVEEYCNKW